MLSVCSLSRCSIQDFVRVYYLTSEKAHIEKRTHERRQFMKREKSKMVCNPTPLSVQTAVELLLLTIRHGRLVVGALHSGSVFSRALQ